MRPLAMTILLVLNGFISQNAVANSKVEKYQQQVAGNLKNLSTDELVWVRAYNNTYNTYCNNHSTSKYYNLFYEVASETIVGEMLSRDDWSSPIWQAKYGYRKGLLNGLRQRIGTDGYCYCIYNHIMKGESSCLNQ
jgi:hypothetical protein